MTLHQSAPGPTGKTAVFPGPGVYPLLDRDTCLKRGLDPIQVVKAWRAAGNVPYYQLRAKGLGDQDYVRLARQLREAVPELALFANDCIAATADSTFADRAGTGVFSGLHLGQEDLRGLGADALDRLAKLRRERPDFILGLSTHGVEQLRSACLGKGLQGGISGSGGLWSYLALGPCFPTRSKPTGRDPVLTAEQIHACLELLADVLRASGSPRGFPLVLIGGVNSSNIEELLKIYAAAPGAGLIRIVVAGIESGLDASQISDLIEKIQKYSS
ncbi:MAG: thiamine phosphate synthase [Leptospirales bacterium]|jgi:thiamine-phosphate pyrophosphorylase